MEELNDTRPVSADDTEERIPVSLLADEDGQESFSEFDGEGDENPTFRLEIFEGPLDLLLALIAKNKVNIYDIPISLILEQYLDYIHQMELFNMEVASSFIVMASQLMVIKSRMLLPTIEEEEDPRQELVDMLLEYKRARTTADVLHQRETTYAGRFEKPAEDIGIDPEYKLTHDVEILREALRHALSRVAEDAEDTREIEENLSRHLTATRQVSVGEKIRHVLGSLKTKKKQKLGQFFDEVESRDEIVATFLALLELIKNRRVEVVYYSEDYADCDITLSDEPMEELPDMFRDYDADYIGDTGAE